MKWSNVRPSSAVTASVTSSAVPASTSPARSSRASLVVAPPAFVARTTRTAEWACPSTVKSSRTRASVRFWLITGATARRSSSRGIEP